MTTTYDERTAIRDALFGWSESLSRDDWEGDPRDLARSAFRAAWQAGLLHERQASAARMAALRTTVLGFRNVRTADDGLPCWCVTEHAHHKYGCGDLRAALSTSTDGEAG